MITRQLQKLIGVIGVEALSPLLKSEDLANFIVPRVVIGWLQKSPLGVLELEPFQILTKSVKGYSGSIMMQGVDHHFEDASETLIAAMISVVSGQKALTSSVKSLDLAKLSKTLDSLLKTSAPKIEAKEDVNTPAPQQPPVGPISPQRAISSVAHIRSRALAKTLWVPEKATRKCCKLCGKAQFEKGELVGCNCLKALVKSVACAPKLNNSYCLTFQKACSIDEVLTLAQAMGLNCRLS
jgi:hypothetical protein